jgi:hypothetical protein
VEARTLFGLMESWLPGFLENSGGFSVMMHSVPSRVVSQGGLSNTRFLRSCR